MFQSFFFAGFEGTTTWNRRRRWIDQIAATEHDVQANEDYRLLGEHNLMAAREAIRWPVVDRLGRYDFSSVQPFLEASAAHGIEVIWDLFHYGYPPDLDPFSEAFIVRFAAYCHAAAEFVAARTSGTCYFTPVNEPSYLAWAGGAMARFAPHARDRAPELKIALARAAIAGIEAIWSAAPGARIVNVDPVCNIVPPREHPGNDAGIDHFNHHVVFESWDMLAGRTMPELGGSRAHLDIIGINYYWTNQWEVGREEEALPEDDPRRVSLAGIMRRVWRRYGGDFLITETAHVGNKRPSWLRSVAHECAIARAENLPLRGVCLYPILSMPDWHDRTQWARMGLWDLDLRRGRLHREIHHPTLEALREVQGLDALQGDHLHGRP